MHEELMTKVGAAIKKKSSFDLCRFFPRLPLPQTFCSEAFERVKGHLTATQDPAALSNYKNMVEISRGVCQTGGVMQEHPLGV